MNPCAHDWLEPGATLNVEFTIDSWQGPTEAIVACNGCGSYALLRLVYWCGSALATRCYALSLMAPQPVRTFLRDMGTPYCDLARHEAELAALYSVAAPVSRIVVAVVPGMKVLASHDSSVLPDFKIMPWRQLRAETQDSRWRALIPS